MALIIEVPPPKKKHRHWGLCHLLREHSINSWCVVPANASRLSFIGGALSGQLALLAHLAFASAARDLCALEVVRQQVSSIMAISYTRIGTKADQCTKAFKKLAKCCKTLLGCIQSIGSFRCEHPRPCIFCMLRHHLRKGDQNKPIEWQASSYITSLLLAQDVLSSVCFQPPTCCSELGTGQATKQLTS